MPDLSILINEIENDPLSRGYAAMTDRQVADSLNMVNRSANRLALVQEVRSYLATELNGTGNNQRSSLDMVREFAEAGTVRGTAPTVNPTQSLAARRSACQMIWCMLRYGFANEGFLVGNANVRAQFASIGPDGGNGPNVLTTAQLTAIAALAAGAVSRGEELQWGIVQDYEVRWARGN